MKILVTGGAGYIGSIMVPELIKRGHQVTVLDNFMFNQNSLASSCSDFNFEIIKGDIRNETLLKEIISNFDVIIPLAALVGAPLCNLDPVSATSINHDAMLNLFKITSNDQLILMPTTNSAYGSGDSNNKCSETSELKPLSKYAVDKVQVEIALMEKKNAISFRLATVFGMSPRMRIDLLVNDFVYRAFKDQALVLFEGHFKRNYIHVRDVVRVFLHGIENREKMIGQIYNVGLSTANLSKIQLCDAIQKQIPNFCYVNNGSGKDPDQRNYVVSNEKIESTGFLPKHSIDDGIIELIKGYTMIKNSVYGNI